MKRKLIVLFFCLCGHLSACTDFVIKARDGSLVNGRSMEFGTDLHSELIIFPKGLHQQSTLPNGKKGMSWKVKYAYIGMNAFGLEFLSDGMNEKGLSIGALWFPETKYPSIKGSATDKMISLMDLENWLLGSFTTIQEVKRALSEVEIWPQEIPQINEVPPLHFALHDASGASMVVEFVEGKMKIYDNHVAVLTNSPAFPWHVTNLRNYISLSAMNVAPIDLDGSVLSPTGQGSGLLGIPGDWTPPSRFVRIAIFKNFVNQAQDAEKNANLAFHLLNTVDIPYGAIRDKKEQNYDYTQWVIVKDLTNRKIYWRTYEDLNIREIDFTEALKKAGKQIKKIPL
ncbi:MAG: Choloylglycine hydrolase [Chlamydiae bacterium]|nr:Choloylglycine hydrolase [Chlamydiota bacterium]